ncbi:MAG: sulfurtransferase TusA family protein [SAR324 cluster bacterium]|nr:sulfurtransferase TusA family protein [SAR324 cluster bacterium]
MSENQIDQELDCRGLKCPLPILRTKKAIDRMVTGQVLKMVATDPGAINDMKAWTSRTGNALVDSSQGDGEFIFYVRKK